MSNNNVTVLESYPMHGGDGKHSYSKNSSLQRQAARHMEAKIQEEIKGKLDIRKLSCASDTLRIVDLGCSVGPNTFIAMNNVIEAMKHKLQIQDPTASKMPEFHVFFNDHSSNDFNTLFASLPPERQYFAAGVPGSFHTRLFPQSSIHFAYSAHSLHWLSKVPEKVLDKNSPAWNKGRIHYTNASEHVRNAFADQFSKDVEMFLEARAMEIVAGGMMVLIMMKEIPDDIPRTSIQTGLLFDLIGSCLMDMAKEEIISESLVDSFNLPVYAATAKEMKEIIERNGCFSIESLESTNPLSEATAKIDTRGFIAHFRAGMSGIISKHFGNEIIDELFDRVKKKAEENSNLSNNPSYNPDQLFIVLIRK